MYFITVLTFKLLNVYRDPETLNYFKKFSENSYPIWTLSSQFFSYWVTFLVTDIIRSYLAYIKPQFSSVQFSLSVVSNYLRPHEPQHTRPPCPSPTPKVHPNPCPLSQWCYPTTSSSVVPFSFCPQTFPTLGSFPMSQLFTSGGQILERQLHHQSFQWTLRTDFL